MGRKPCCDKIGLKKGPWTSEEDKKLINFILTNAQCSWRSLPKLAGLLRCGKSCRLRWTNYLRPDLKRGLLSEHEEQIVIDLHAQIGNRWSKIASKLPGRTDNEIKNHWNTHIKKKLRKMGIDPLTHKPLLDHESQQQQQEGNLSVAQSTQETSLSATITEEEERSTGGISDDMIMMNNFSIEDVPLVQPAEISSSSSSSYNFSLLEEFLQMPDSEWPNCDYNNINDLGLWDINDLISS